MQPNVVLVAHYFEMEKSNCAKKTDYKQPSFKTGLVSMAQKVCSTVYARVCFNFISYSYSHRTLILTRLKKQIVEK